METKNLGFRYIVLSTQRIVGSKVISIKWGKKVIELSKDKNPYDERLRFYSAIKIKAKIS